jgi:sugar lactone lactonase YvrE
MPHCPRCVLLLSLACTLNPSVSLVAARQISSAATGSSDTAFVLARAGVIPENIVYDAPRDRFLGGDLERDGMIELRRDGSIRPFADAAAIDGRVLGLKIDRRRNLLWGVAFTRLPASAGDSTQAPARSIVFALDLPGGRPVRRVHSPKDGASHLFNDLVVGRDGTVYFTDSEGGAVWAHRSPRYASWNGAAPISAGPPPARSSAIPSSTLPMRKSAPSIPGRMVTPSRRSWC